MGAGLPMRTLPESDLCLARHALGLLDALVLQKPIDGKRFRRSGREGICAGRNLSGRAPTSEANDHPGKHAPFSHYLSSSRNRVDDRSAQLSCSFRAQGMFIAYGKRTGWVLETALSSAVPSESNKGAGFSP